MDLKKKFENAKTKVKTHAPELIGFASTLFVGGVLIYLTTRQTPRYYANYTAYNPYYREDNDVDSGKKTSDEEMTHRQTITPEEMSKLMDDGTISAFSVDGTNVTFYDLNVPQD